MLKVAKKYILSFPAEKEDDLMDLLKKSWNFEAHPIGPAADEGEINRQIQDNNYLISSVDFAISYLNRFAPKKSFLETIAGSKIPVKSSDLKELEKKNSFVKTLIDRVVFVEKEISLFEKQLKVEEEKIKGLKSYGSLDFIPSETFYSFSFLAAVDKKEKEALENFSFKKGIFLKQIGGNQLKAFYVFICLKDQTKELMDFLGEIKGEQVPYEYPEPPQAEVEKAEYKIKDCKNKILALIKEAKKMTESLTDLKVYHDFLSLRKRQFAVKKETLEKGFFSYFVFWAEEKEKQSFEKRALAISNEIRIIETALEEGEKPPVLLENSRLAGPFQSVTDIYGLPSEKEIDPTPYLALFFIVYFGICITDAAYGLILSLLCLIPLVFLKKRFGKNKLIKLLFLGGISTFIIGALFGSYFGVSPEQIGLPFLSKIKLIDPMKDTVLFMGLTFALGFIQVCFSHVVRIIKGLKIRSKEDILGGTAWISFFAGFVFFVLTKTLWQNLALLSAIVFVASVLGLGAFESKGQKVFLKPLVGSIKILQGIISTMSDILSYSRLMALGLGTAVIALIVNQIAFLFGGMIPYVGWLFAGIILVVGHLFNLGINALGGFIHSARLQFVEFFPKFLEGGGRRLKPIGNELKYIEIN